MGVIQDKANAIAADMNTSSVKHPSFIISITLIAALIEIIYNSIEIYKDCGQTPQKATVSMQSGGLLERFRLRRVIREKLSNNPEIQNLDGHIFGSTLNVAKQLQENEVVQMYAEVDVPLV